MLLCASAGRSRCEAWKCAQRRRRIHALIGANGAGKSTFLGIIAGRVAPTEGQVSIFGRPHSFGSPRVAHQLGVAAIYQELTIVPAMSTQANVFLGQTISRFGLAAKRQMREEYLRLCERLGVSIPPDVPAGRLAIADQQMLEIMRGIRSGARLLLFDEPTASLAPPECEALLRIMRDLKGAWREHDVCQPQARGGARNRGPRDGIPRRQGGCLRSTRAMVEARDGPRHDRARAPNSTRAAASGPEQGQSAGS